VALTSSVAEHIVSIGSNGKAQEIGRDISVALESDPSLAKQMAQDEEAIEMEENVLDIDTAKKEGEKVDGKLILEEEIAQGHVSWRSLKLFLKGLGGSRPVFFFTVYLVGLVLMHGGNLLATWFLGYWGSQYESRSPEEVRVPL